MCLIISCKNTFCWTVWKDVVTFNWFSLYFHINACCVSIFHRVYFSLCLYCLWHVELPQRIRMHYCCSDTFYYLFSRWIFLIHYYLFKSNTFKHSVLGKTARCFSEIGMRRKNKEKSDLNCKETALLCSFAPSVCMSKGENGLSPHFRLKWHQINTHIHVFYLIFLVFV